ncbi:MAG: hypothetical protein ABIQ35_07550 [Verrucomicrobiota bacterium]
MKEIFVHGIGAVSPAGWGVEALRKALDEKNSIATKPLTRPGWENSLQIRQVPAPPARPGFLSHARLRRTSPITHFGVSAGLEALGEEASAFGSGQLRLGVVQCVMSGCINYSRRFYDETLRDPASASPLVFPETVFNAPASHLAALLGTNAINYTLIGDPGTFLQGIALASNWLLNDRVDGCLVIGAEETDWLTADAFRRFQRKMILSDGAGAIFLRAEDSEMSRGLRVENRASERSESRTSRLGTRTKVRVSKITDAHPYLQNQSRHCAASKMRAELAGDFTAQLLCDSTQGVTRLDGAESEAWKDWAGLRVSPKTILGEGLMAAAGWQCVAAIDAIREGRCDAANVSVVGCNQQAIGAEFISGNVARAGDGA